MKNGYQLLDTLHETKISIIKKIKDIENDRYLVVKEIKGMDHITKLLFDREINALKKLNNNRSIVKIYDYEVVGSEDGTSLTNGRIYLEYIEGENLAEISLDLIEFRDKYGLMFQIVDAIELAHSNGIIHRDIKPDNIMIEDYRNAKLIDFGISKIKGVITKETVANFASNMYTAPEVRYHNENATFQSDIYSLGATIYYLMTGIEPCLPVEFPLRIKETPGINPKLKEMLIKSVQSKPKDRYESVTDLKRDLDTIFQDLLDSSKFVITVPINIYSTAKRKKFLSENVSYNEFIETILPEWFSNCYAFIDTKLDGKKNLTQEQEIAFFGNQYKLICAYKDDDEYFIVSDLVYVQPKVRNTLLSTYMRVNGVIAFYPSSKDITNVDHKTYELATELIDHRILYESDENKQNKFDRFFGIWTDYLDNEKELIQTTAKKVLYKSFHYDKDTGSVNIEIENTNIEELGFTSETVLIYDPSLLNAKVKKSNIITVGTFEDYIFKNEKVFMSIKVAKGTTLNQLPESGCLVEDYRTALYVIDKQIKALWTLRKNECECNENLRDLILGFENPTSIDSFNTIDFFNKRLDSNQQEAVRKALCTSSVCVIQGPPGTGKTSVIREIVNQVLKRDNEDFGQKRFRILIVSQSHTAVDHVLEGLQISNDLHTQVIRIGNSDKIIDSVWEKYSIENSHKSWVEKTIKASNARVQELIKGYNIDSEKLHKYIESKFNATHSQLSESETSFIEEFESEYSSDKQKKRIVNTAIIQQDWISRLRLARDSEGRMVENATIVAGTCTGFNANPVVKNMSFDYVIVDEAAKASVPELLIPLLKGSRLILVGDQNQLPPVLKDEVIKMCEDLKREDFENGLFKHLYECFPKSNRVMLSMQYRMHKIIGKMISKVFYNNSIDTGIEESERTHDLKCFNSIQILWISTSLLHYNDRKETELEGSTFKNNAEARIIKSVLQKIDKEEAARNYEIALITGYSAQKSLLRENLKRLDFQNIKDIEVNTVDAYQGRDKDIIIFSTVRSNNFNAIGFQKSEKRVNVAFSRARRLIIIIGDHDHFYKNHDSTNRFPQIIDYIKGNSGCKLECVEVGYEGR